MTENMSTEDYRAYLEKENKEIESALKKLKEIFDCQQIRMNGLSEENKRLNDEFTEYIDLKYNQIMELKEENEQLKQLLKSINGSFTFDDNYVSWFEDCVIVSKEGLKEISLGSDFE